MTFNREEFHAVIVFLAFELDYQEKSGSLHINLYRVMKHFPTVLLIGITNSLVV